MTTAKVTKSVYGNYRGVIGGKIAKDIGCNEFDAKEWLSNALRGGLVLSNASHLGMAEITAHRNRCGDAN